MVYKSEQEWTINCSVKSNLSHCYDFAIRIIVDCNNIINLPKVAEKKHDKSE